MGQPLYCGHCKRYHFNRNQVLACSQKHHVVPAQTPAQTLPKLPETFKPANTQPPAYRPSQPRVIKTDEPATDPQLYAIRNRAERLKMQPMEIDRLFTQAYNRLQASNLIGNLQQRIDGVHAQQMAQQAQPEPTYHPSPLPVPTYTAPEDAFLPKNMMDMIRPGRYAVRTDGTLPWVFLRISVGGKHSKYPGGLKIQTQHAEDLIDRMVYRENGKMQLFRRDKIQGQELSDLILVLITDQTSAAIQYGQELKQCCRCGIHLTDPRSLHYGIGSECEKHWPWIIETVNDTKGEYVPAVGA